MIKTPQEQQSRLKRFNSVPFVLVLTLFACGVNAADENPSITDGLYRYTDANGRTVMANNIPPEYVKNGYTVLNRHGQVVKVVAAALTARELAERDGAASEQAQKRRDEKIQQEQDQQLLRTFSTVADANAAMQRKLTALDVIIDITKGNVSRLGTQLDDLKSKAARIERGGGEVDQGILDDINSLRRQIRDSNSFVVEKQSEKVQVKKDSEGVIQRLKHLGR